MFNLDMEASYLKSYLLKSGITKDTLEVLKQEHITSMDIFTSLSQGHWASLLPKLKIGQHALLMKLILSDTSEVKMHQCIWQDFNLAGKSYCSC